MTDFHVSPSIPTALDSIHAHSDRLGITRIIRRIHRWASPAWKDLPALLRTLRDASVVSASGCSSRGSPPPSLESQASSAISTEEAADAHL